MYIYIYVYIYLYLELLVKITTTYTKHGTHTKINRFCELAILGEFAKLRKSDY